MTLSLARTPAPERVPPEQYDDAYGISNMGLVGDWGDWEDWGDWGDWGGETGEAITRARRSRRRRRRTGLIAREELLGKRHPLFLVWSMHCT